MERRYDKSRHNWCFWSSRKNDNGRRVVEFCAKSGQCVGNTRFMHRSLHKHTRVARRQDGVEIKSKIDLALVKRDMLRYVQDGARPLRQPCCTV